MRICFLMEPPRSPSSVTFQVIEGLKGDGADVEIVTERTGLVDLENFKFDYDMYLFKSHSPLAESLAAAAHYRGATLLNESPATMKVRDKVLTCTMLLQAGLPTPRTFITDNIETLRPIAVRHAIRAGHRVRGARLSGVAGDRRGLAALRRAGGRPARLRRRLPA